MSDLTEFLLARIAEDEAVALEVQAKAGDESSPLGYFEDAEGSAASAYFDRDYRQGGYTITAVRVLAECEAKRRMVAIHAPVERTEPRGFPETADIVCSTCAEFDFFPWEGVADAFPCATARLLALPYADHPDYREEWRP